MPPYTSWCHGNNKSKCAEIHYQRKGFSILCMFCGINAFNYQDFIEHFQRLHCDEFSNQFQSSAEPLVYAFSENGKTYHDPLELENTDMASDPNEVFHKSKKGLGLKTLKSELDEESTNCLNKVQHRSELTPSTFIASLSGTSRTMVRNSELVKSEVKEEESDFREFQCASNKFEYEEEDNFFYSFTRDTEHESATKVGQNTENESLNESLIGNCPEDVDWSKSYEPNLLKNHEKRPYKPRNEPNICTYCGRTFKRRYQLETHLNVHTGDKPYQCDICGRLFRAITTLMRHLNTHEQRQMFYCKFCKKSFTHKVALLSHELRHTQERKVPCDACDRWFYTANQMDTHKRKVHNNSVQNDLPFVCDICTKCFRSGSMLSTHKFKKHYKTAKFTCEKCGKKCINEQQLQAHKHIHVNKE